MTNKPKCAAALTTEELIVVSAALCNYSKFSDFVTYYDVPKSYIDQIVAVAAQQGVKPKNDDEYQRTLPQLKLQLKALIARDMWDLNHYYQIINESNDIVKKAIELLK